MTQEDLFKIGLLDAIQALHMSMSGAADKLGGWNGPWEEKDYYQALKIKFNEWKPSIIDKHILYDNSVRLLLFNVLLEYEKEYGVT